jgi:hypothetical protein
MRGGALDAPQDEGPGKKTCSRCKNPDLLITDFYLATKTGANPDAPRRRMHWCKQCHKDYSANRRKTRLTTEGQAYRDAENKRVRAYMSQPQVADKRRASERANQAAMRELKLRHIEEYQALLAAARQLEGLG